MNLSTIVSKVTELVTEASGIRTRDTGGKVYALMCEIGGKTKSVQFTNRGLYGENRTSMYADWPKTELYIAAEIAKELRK